MASFVPIVYIKEYEEYAVHSSWPESRTDKFSSKKRDVCLEDLALELQRCSRRGIIFTSREYHVENGQSSLATYVHWSGRFVWWRSKFHGPSVEFLKFSSTFILMGYFLIGNQGKFWSMVFSSAIYFPIIEV